MAIVEAPRKVNLKSLAPVAHQAAQGLAETTLTARTEVLSAVESQRVLNNAMLAVFQAGLRVLQETPNVSSRRYQDRTFDYGQRDRVSIETPGAEIEGIDPHTRIVVQGDFVQAADTTPDWTSAGTIRVALVGNPLSPEDNIDELAQIGEHERAIAQAEPIVLFEISRARKDGNAFEIEVSDVFEPQQVLENQVERSDEIAQSPIAEGNAARARQVEQMQRLLETIEAVGDALTPQQDSAPITDATE